MEQENNLESQSALRVAFHTMVERCQQLEARLATVEEENIGLRLKNEKYTPTTVSQNSGLDENNIIQSQQEKIEELEKQKLLLSHHISMVSSENQQLWKRLSQLTRVNKSLGNRLTKISDSLKQHCTVEKSSNLVQGSKEILENTQDNKNDKGTIADNEGIEESLEEISLRIKNNFMIEKSQLEQQCADMIELQTNTEMNLKNIGFTYPEDINTDSLEQLKYQDIRLTQIKEELVSQQNKLKSALQNFKKIKKNETCNNCKKSIEKLMCQTGTQFESDNSFKENGETQTSLTTSNCTAEKKNLKNVADGENVCPLCGVVYKTSVSFDVFHEHVIHHFTKEASDEYVF